MATKRERRQQLMNELDYVKKLTNEQREELRDVISWQVKSEKMSRIRWGMFGFIISICGIFLDEICNVPFLQLHHNEGFGFIQFIIIMIGVGIIFKSSVKGL